MSDTTQNKDVQSACCKRISKLKDEMRFCQIVKERHKIQSMLESSGVEEVKLACRERLKQLVLELDMLNLEEDILELKVAAKEGDVIGKVGQENEQWYQRVLQYVAPSEHEEHQDRDLRASPSHHGAESRSVGWHSHTNHDKFRGPLHHVQNQQPWREDYRRRTSEPNYHHQQYSPHSPRYQNRPVQQSPIRGPPADPWRILTPRSGFSGNTSSSTPTNKDRIIQQQQYHNFGRQEGPAAKAVKSNGLDELITYLAS